MNNDLSKIFKFPILFAYGVIKDLPLPPSHKSCARNENVFLEVMNFMHDVG